MASGLPDRVDCERLADDKAALQRVYDLRGLPRLQDLLADNQGEVHADFAFERISGGRAGVTIRVQAQPHLLCQRCLQGFSFEIDEKSEVEFADSEDVTPSDPQREIYVMERGLVSLRDLVEEELLLAIPAIAACTSPETCGKTPVFEEERSRPLAVLRDILKKT